MYESEWRPALNALRMSLFLIFLLGIVSGIRTFTAPAVLWVMRHGGPWAYVLSAAALFENYLDVNPNAPARTKAFGLACRIAGGAFVGWWSAIATGISPPLGAVVAVVGAIAGTYGSYLLRKRAIAVIGNVPSGILEDSIAIAASAAIVARL